MPVITVGARLVVTGATPAQRDRLLDGARAESKAYVQAVRMAVPHWRRPERWIELGEVDGDTVTLPRGLTKLVREVVPGATWKDERVRVPHAFTYSRELRAEQIAAVDAICRREQGAAIAPPGTGKSAIAQGAAARLGLATLIAAPSLAILAQFERDALDHLGVRAAVVGDGRDETGPLTLATFASLRDPDRRARLYPMIGAAFFDEAHGTTADETRAIVDECPAAVRIALTATPPTDERRAIFDALFGAMIFRATPPELVGLGRLSRPGYREVATSFRYAGDPTDFGALVSAVLADEARTLLVIDTITERCGPHRLGLVLTGRIEHAKQLAGALRGRGLRAAHLTGDVPGEERERILTAARMGGLDVLTATTVADEGLDVPRISDVYLCAPQLGGGRFYQRIGRAMRPHAGKPDPEIVDFVDGHVPLLASQARKRRRAFFDLWRAEAA